jgi:hypothetical protein
MPGLSRADLAELIQKRSGHCVSIYMPTERPGGDTRQNSIRFKNLLNEAESKLVESGLRSVEASRLLRPAAALLDESLFWVRQLDGLAVFVSDDLFKRQRQPIAFEPVVAVGNRFTVRPQLPLLTGDGPFYVLALSQGAVRLLRGTRFTIDEVDLEDVPHSLREALRFDAFESQLQWHVSSPGGAGATATFHGHGGTSEYENTELFSYFRQVDRGLTDALSDSRAPLIVAGVDYLHPIYASANTYPGLMAAGILGNPETLSNNELHDRAWQLVAAKFDEDTQAAIELYGSQLSSGRASDRLTDVVGAAYAGRVDTLFAPVDGAEWGAFDRDSGDLELHSERLAQSEDLVELAVVYTLSNGGTVLPLDPARLRVDGPMAAVYRY